jgi:hypothetical protein
MKAHQAKIHRDLKVITPKLEERAHLNKEF